MHIIYHVYIYKAVYAAHHPCYFWKIISLGNSLPLDQKLHILGRALSLSLSLWPCPHRGISSTHASVRETRPFFTRHLLHKRPTKIDSSALMEDKEMPEKITGEMPSLHSSPKFTTWAITHFIGELPSVPDQGDRALKMDAFVNRLQEEMGKIEASKHELPLCITLLNDGNIDLYANCVLCLFLLKTRKSRTGWMSLLVNFLVSWREFRKLFFTLLCVDGKLRTGQFT